MPDHFPPPLVEALCEFRFTIAKDWDWTLPGRLYERLRDDFPEVEQPPMGAQFDLRPGEATHVVVPFVPMPSLVRLKRSDGSAMVQVGPGILAVNHFPAGYQWSLFCDLILRVHQIHAELEPQRVINRVGLRYVNVVPLDEPKDIAEVISVKPSLPAVLAKPLSGYYQRLEIQHDEPAGMLLLQTALQLASGNTRSVVVDLDFGALGNGVPTDDSALRHWLKASHDRIKESLFGTLTPAMNAAYGFPR